MSQQTPHSTRQRHTNPTLDDAGVHAATRSDYDTPEDVVATLEHQPTRSPLVDEYCCVGGDHGFRVYNSDLPVIRRQDITPGRLVYRPTTSPLHVYECLSPPYENEHGADIVDVRVYSRSHTGADAPIRTRTDTLFTASIVDEHTFVQPQTVQTTLER